MFLLPWTISHQTEHCLQCQLQHVCRLYWPESVYGIHCIAFSYRKVLVVLTSHTKWLKKYNIRCP